jgi:hypothetical protein
MAFYFQKSYRPEIEQLLRQYSQSLSEKDRRRFAALEAIKLGHGGIRYMAKVLGGAPQTIKDGLRELKQLPDDPAGRRIRKPGGGRKKTAVKHADLIQQVHDTIKDRTAGAPMRADVVWTDLPPPKRLPTGCKPKASVLDPASCDACSRRLVWPVARWLRSCPAAPRRLATRRFAIWPISCQSFSRPVPRS